MQNWRRIFTAPEPPSALQAVENNAHTFQTVSYLSEQEAASDVRAGRIDGVVIIPPAFSRRVYAENRPALGLVLDNTDQFVSSAITQSLSGLVTALNQSPVESRLPKQSQESGVRSTQRAGAREDSRKKITFGRPRYFQRSYRMGLRI
jgi:ABC-type Na+ efflux pump permease subunit